MIDSARRLKVGAEVACVGFSRLKARDFFSNDGPVIEWQRDLKRYFVRIDTIFPSGGPAVCGQGDSVKILGVFLGNVGDLGMEKKFRSPETVACIGQLGRLPGPFDSIEEAKAGESHL
jgi:hypothetical protein